MTVMILTCAVALPLIISIHRRGEELEGLARKGEVQSDAPVKASLQIVIQAPPEKVWSVLTGVNDWPKWQSDIKEAAIEGPLQSGTTFKWSAGGTHITSKIALVEPNVRIAWTGSALDAQAIHVWSFQRLPGNKTLVNTDESISGFLLTYFYSSKELQATDQHWLDRLKHKAER
jgi:uncharacterized protein YndB with AHSA1/START domain